MNFKDTIEFAGAISAHSQHLFDVRQPVSSTALGYYWKLQRSWLNRMQLLFEDIAEGLQVLPNDHELHNAMTTALHEITSGELILRTWSTILTAKDQLAGTSEHIPLIRNLHIAMLDLRRRYLALLLDERLPSEDFIMPVDRQRRRAENWTNFICGHLVSEHNVTEYVHHEHDARTYHLEHLYYLLSREIPRHDDRREFAMSSLDYLIASDTCDEHSRPIGLPEIAGAILNCYPHSAFNDHGLFRPIRTTKDKHQKILQLGARA